MIYPSEPLPRGVFHFFMLTLLSVKIGSRREGLPKSSQVLAVSKTVRPSCLVLLSDSGDYKVVMVIV